MVLLGQRGRGCELREEPHLSLSCRVICPLILRCWFAQMLRGSTNTGKGDERRSNPFGKFESPFQSRSKYTSGMRCDVQASEILNKPPPCRGVALVLSKAANGPTKGSTGPMPVLEVVIRKICRDPFLPSLLTQLAPFSNHYRPSTPTSPADRDLLFEHFAVSIRPFQASFPPRRRPCLRYKVKLTALHAAIPTQPGVPS